MVDPSWHIKRLTIRNSISILSHSTSALSSSYNTSIHFLSRLSKRQARLHQTNLITDHSPHRNNAFQHRLHRLHHHQALSCPEVRGGMRLLRLRRVLLVHCHVNQHPTNGKAIQTSAGYQALKRVKD
ncbi:hypothetical protein HBI82_159360 [Parastagonospora nodorum]|nr:hypothetical protein HBI76_173970 [Parastagonospora nodorum]KAH6001892.1 hypothetical protein HBI82_159360 [Parastagonospora nodorum]KAH6392230.1 hypothetical protein HBI60_160770 [Parastagonospora nodorum]